MQLIIILKVIKFMIRAHCLILSFSGSKKMVIDLVLQLKKDLLFYILM